MIIGTVLGPVDLSAGIPGTEGKRFVQVRCGPGLVTALDPIGTKPGQAVLLAAGEGAGRLCPDVPVDAVILGVAGNKG